MRKLFTHTDTTVREVKLGNGSTKIFNLAMEFFENADLVINLVVIATGVKTLQVITTDYTLSGGSGASGTVTMIVAPPATDNLVIERKQPGTQAIDYEPNSPIPAETIEEGLDRSAMLANQAKSLADRAMVFPIDEAASSDGELPVKALRLDKVMSFHKTTGDPETIITVTAINDAATEAAAAVVSAANAATSATNAATSETNAATSETNAATSATAAAADLVLTNADVVLTNADVVLTGLDVVAAAASAVDAVVNAAGFRFNFDNSTSMVDPGSGDIRFNNATLANVTALAIDALSADAGSPDVSAYTALWGSSTTLLKRGTITIRKIGTPATFVTFDIDAVVVDNTGWLQIPVAFVASNGTFSAADKLIVHFTRTGDKGDTGAGDMTGPASSTNNAVARYDLATGKLLQNSVVTISDTGALAGITTIALSSTIDGRDLETDGTKLDGISAGAEVNPTPISQADAEAGTATIEQMFTAERVKQAIQKIAEIGVDVQAFDANLDALAALTPVAGRHIGYDTSGAEAVVRSGFSNNGYETGQYYTIGGDVVNTNTLVVTANRMYFRPFIVVERTTFTRIVVEVTAGAGTSGRVGVYDFANGVPGALVFDAGTFATDSAAVKDVTISQTLMPGIYASATIFDNTPTVRANFNRGFVPGGLHDSAFGVGVDENAGYRTFTFAALPDPFGAITARLGDNVNSNVPDVGIRIV